LLAAEAMIVLLNIVGIGLLLSTVLRPTTRRGVIIGAFVALALAMKMLASWLLGKPQPLWAGLTPGMIAGLALAAALLAGLMPLHHRARLAAALVCLILGLAAMNFAPGNPYFILPERLASGHFSHQRSFWSILRALSELWPLLAIGYLSIAWWRQRQGRKQVKVI
jgi:hypothetical protein